MNNTTKASIGGFIAAVLVFVFLLAFASPAKANPSAFKRDQLNSVNGAVVATSTYRAIAAGSGTSTITETSSNGNLADDSAVLNLRYTASTTAPVLAIRIEHSYDGIDWYAEVPTNTNASTTATTFTENRLTFSTTTDAQYGSPGSGVGTAATSTVMREITITTPTRFTRAVIYGISGNGSLYGEIIAKQQNI